MKKQIILIILLIAICAHIPAVTEETTTYTVTYHSVPDPYYGVPENENIPETDTILAGEFYELRKTPEPKVAYAENNQTGKLDKGVWCFSPLWKLNSIKGMTTAYIHNPRRDYNFYGKWIFKTKPYVTVEYKAVADTIYGIPEDIVMPEKDTKVSFGNDYMLTLCPRTNLKTAKDPTTNEEIKGEWISDYEWYTKEKDGQRVYALNSILKDTTVYTKWSFVPENTLFTVTYHTYPDPVYGEPEGAFTPEPQTNISFKSNVTLIRPPVEMDSKDHIAINSRTNEKEYGIWVFSPIWHDKELYGKKILTYENITENKDVYGRWYFYPT